MPHLCLLCGFNSLNTGHLQNNNNNNNSEHLAYLILQIYLKLMNTHQNEVYKVFK